MKKNPYIVGLTGGIGCGKSTLAAAFRSLGIQSVDADYASRAVVQQGMPALTDISAKFGKDIVLSDGQLDIITDVIRATYQNQRALEIATR